MLRGLFDGPEADWDYRRRMTEQAFALGPEWLHAQLASVDAATAARLHPNDMRRIIRALEVQHVTGRPLSEQQAQGVRPDAEQPRAVLWISPPRDWLYQRIDQRVDQMMEDGLLEETRWLLSLNPPPGRTALQALGYRELIAHLNRESSLADAVQQIKTGPGSSPSGSIPGSGISARHGHSRSKARSRPSNSCKKLWRLPGRDDSIRFKRS